MRRVLFLLLSIILFSTSPTTLFSQQISFGKSEGNNAITYKYEIRNEQENTLFTTNFVLNTQDVKLSYTKIPNLNDLRRKIKPELEEVAQKILDKYTTSLNQALNEELELLMNQESLGELFTYSIVCTETDPIIFSFSYSISGEFRFTTKITGCNISTDTQEAWQHKIKLIVEKIDTANAQLQYGSHINIKIKKNSYSIQSKLSAPNQKLANKQNIIIRQTLEEVKIIENEYKKNSQSLQKNINTVQDKQKAIIQKYHKKTLEVKDELSEEFRRVQQQKFQEYYFLIENIRNRPTIILDYKKIVEEGAKDVSNVSGALQDNALDKRAQIQKLLTFLQTIPYNRLLGREDEGYSGFLPPLGLIDKNKGDCDTKSVMFLSMIKNLYPEMESVLILVPNHAYVGIHTTPQSGDETITYQGKTFVVAEPVGPALIALGKIGEQSSTSSKVIQKIISINE